MKENPISRQFRSATSIHGRNMAGARSLWRTAGMGDEDFGKPIIAAVSSFTELAPGHIRLHDTDKLVSDTISAAGGVAKKMNTIAADGDIVMGHDGMLYSLSLHELTADPVEYMVNAHRVGTMVCTSSCDKVTPGIPIAAIRLSIPVIFMSGGPMETGKSIDPSAIIGPVYSGHDNLVTVVNATTNNAVSNEELLAIEKLAYPTCSSCSGMSAANPVNCLTEALGLSLPGSGSTLVARVTRHDLFLRAGELIVDLYRRYYEKGDDSALPRSTASVKAFRNVMTLDMMMDGSPNTVFRLFVVAHEGGVGFDLEDIAELGRNVSCLSEVAPNHNGRHTESVHRAGGIPRTLGELDRDGFFSHKAHTVHSPSPSQWLREWDPKPQSVSREAIALWRAAPDNMYTIEPLSTSNQWGKLDLDEVQNYVHDVEHACAMKGGLIVFSSNLTPEGAVIKTAGINPFLFHFEGRVCVIESQKKVIEKILDKTVQAGDVIVIRYKGSTGDLDMQEVLYPTSFIKERGFGKTCALITDGRFSGGASRIPMGHILPETVDGGPVGLVEDGDRIIIDVNEGLLLLDVPEEEIEARQARGEAHEHP